MIRTSQINLIKNKENYRINAAIRCVLSAGLMFSLAACKPLSLVAIDPPGPPQYKLGWEDGCDSGVSTQGWDYKLMYGFKQRPEMAVDAMYKDGWNEGFSYCRLSVANTQVAGSFEGIGLGNGF